MGHQRSVALGVRVEVAVPEIATSLIHAIRASIYNVIALNLRLFKASKNLAFSHFLGPFLVLIHDEFLPISQILLFHLQLFLNLVFLIRFQILLKLGSSYRVIGFLAQIHDKCVLVEKVLVAHEVVFKFRN
jgi:hypothetical protein